MVDSVRLAKYLAHAGVASRRAAEQLVFAGRVTVDGEIVTDPARDVDRLASGSRSTASAIGGSPTVARRLRAEQAARRRLDRRDTHGRPTVVDLVRAPGDRRLYPVGRLDADSTGLILLTDDGELAHRLTHPSFEVPKTYRVTVGGPPLRDGGAAAPARGRRARGRHDRARRGAAPRGRRARAHDPRGPQAPGAADVRRGRPSGARARARRASARCGSASSREGQSRRLTPAEIEALRAAADERRVA